MAGKKEYSVDELLKDYAERKKRGHESRYGHGKPSELVASAKVERAAASGRRLEDAERYEKLSDVRKPDDEPVGAGREAGSERVPAGDPEYSGSRERPGEAGSTGERTPKEMVRNKAVILLVYALRSLAIAAMLMLMLFIILHDVMKKRPTIEYFPVVGDTFTEFIAMYATAFAIAFIVPFGLQAAYYLIYRIANKKWKAHTREEIVYALLIAIAGLLGAGLIVWGMGLY